MSIFKRTISLVQLNENIQNVLEANETIERLQECNSEILSGIVYNHLFLGSHIASQVDDGQVSSSEMASINRLTLVPWKETEEKWPSNINYIKSHPNSSFFFTEKSITEVHFEDTLPVKIHMELTAYEANHAVIELTFRSERVKMVKEKIVGNKYRFDINTTNAVVTLKKMTE